jgi:shikimate kinase
VGESRNIRNLILTGFMATGKSCVGRCVAYRLSFDFLDTDAEIERRAGKAISEIFAVEGEASFRAYERQLVIDLAPRSGLVVATGGGLAVDPRNLADLKTNGLVICLWASAETIWQRARRHGHRPLLQATDPAGRIRELLEKRIPYYRQADALISTERRSVKQVSEQVLHQWRLVARPTPST